MQFLSGLGVHAVELNTRIYAELWVRGPHQEHLTELRRASELARSAGLYVHGGHDLTLENLPDPLGQVRFDELSIGHHLIGRAIFDGLDKVVRNYLSVISSRQPPRA